MLICVILWTISVFRDAPISSVCAFILNTVWRLCELKNINPSVSVLSLQMRTHRDDVNPYEDLDRAIGRDSSVDSEVPSVTGFAPVLFIILRQFIQAESSLHMHIVG